MNLPNKLTLFRIILVPFFMFFIMLPKFGSINPVISSIIAALLFLTAALTDMADGKIARKRNLVTDFGKFMDPIADKFMMFGAFFAILASYDKYKYIFVWVVTLVVLRELAVTSIRLVAQGTDGVVIAASKLGKIKTTTQCICVMTILLEEHIFFFIPFFADFRPLSIITTALMLFYTVYSGIDYIRSYWKYLSPNK